jgi:glycosyltransferase involved in cell wall biosynthesis
MLSKIAELKETQVLLVGSTSTPQDEALVRQLKQSQVLITNEFNPHIEELYQLADIYFFPVISDHAAIGVPLSVLEAMACNLKVITTRFGGLPQMFQEGLGLFYFDAENELTKLIIDAKNLNRCSTREMVKAFTWDNIASRVLQTVQNEEIPTWN